MRDFVLGKPIAKDNNNNNNHAAATLNVSTSRPPTRQSILDPVRPVDAPPRYVHTMTNPYARGASASQRVRTSPSPSQNRARAPELAKEANKSSRYSASHHEEGQGLPYHSTPIDMPPATNSRSATLPAAPPTQSATRDAIVPPTTSNPFLLAAKKPRPLAVYQYVTEWIYPSADDFPKRQYQLEISQSAIAHNTLVSLPTGLGKTLIAAVVLYNFYRWFPTGKVIFLAPTLPLVNQQVKACYDVMGIPPEDTAILTGKIQAERRKAVWCERRVFFCTPQTVQKDLESGRCVSSKVVCVVLDEAHKATGDYAYVKVIEQLEAAGAKFRILGLSATPGTNIKAIQQVVDALRINRIEARRETDPDVAQYIHERRSEIVVVKQASACKTIERALNDIVGPLLDRLRSAGALSRVSGNATVTAFNIIKARDESKDDNLIGFFLAAQTFVQIRSDLHRHGVGLVRSKLLRMQNERQRGMTSSIVKGKEFQVLWEEVVKATFDPNSTQANVQDKLVNNPKLTKLREILIEHFERADACSTSSRAIVFSQFRDSVSEIVEILSASEPLIRPRRFVGQGKGTKGDGEKAQLKGMKQVEQHQVIREFRENVFNVLVCTCECRISEQWLGRLP
jgi:fanconi anemia group M protein